MLLESQRDSSLYIGNFPKFLYNATGGGGKGILGPVNDMGIRNIYFSTETFSIPSLSWRNTKILGIPLMPGLEIKIVPKILQGTFNTITNKLYLEFKAEFILILFSLVKAPKLHINTSLKTINQNKYAFDNDKSYVSQMLIGRSIVPKTGHFLLDNFLSLPCEATAELICNLSEFN